MASLDRAIGIDLGTTNSEVAWLPPDERDLVIHADRFGRRTVPSAVAWDEKSAAFLVGHAAKAKRGSRSAPVESIKRKMGQRTTVKLGPHELSPEEVSAKILGELTERMRETLAARSKASDPNLAFPITRAVVTVPAYFDAPQVEATRRAGELAGLSIVGILQEPTAAAIFHTWKRRLSGGTFLVYDLGGGTFDVSIVRCLGGEYQVLAIDGDNFLGGDDFDRRFAEHLRKLLVDKGYALVLDVKGSEEHRALFGRLVHLAQEIKESLSTAEVVHVSKNDFMVDTAGESVSFDEDVGRVDYERIIDDLVETTMACCRRALARSQDVAGVGIEGIDHVILVGGSTRVPLVVRKVTEAFCKKESEPLRDDVDTCVALGAAIHAAHLGGTLLETEGTRLRIATPLVAQGKKLRLGLTAERWPESATRLAIWDGDHSLAEGPLDAEPMRLDLELGEANEIRATLALNSAIGTPVRELPLPLTRGDLRPRPTALSRASVIAKDIALEVVRAGRRERKVLLAHGTGLPALVNQVFYTADQTGAVVLRLLQNRLPIKTLVVDVPRDLPVGTPVEIDVRCDESMRLEARARVGSQEIQAHIEPPAEAGGEEDIDELLEQVERARRALWGGLGAAFGREAELLAGSIREVVYTDPDKLRALAGRLRHLVEEYHGGGDTGLVPPMARMEDAFDVLRRIVYRSKAQLLGMDRAAWEERVESLHDRAMTAHDENDGPGWRRIWNEVQALAETAYQEEFAELRLDDPAYVQRRIVGLSWRAQRLEESVRDLETSRTDEIAVMQISEQKRVMRWLEDAAVKPLRAFGKEPPKDALGDVRRSLDQIESEMERIEQAIGRIPAIGLVTDRGAG